MQYPEIDTGPSSDLGEKEQTMSALVSLMIGTTLSHDFRILPLWAIPSQVPRLMAMITCHLPLLTRSPDSALALRSV